MVTFFTKPVIFTRIKLFGGWEIIIAMLTMSKADLLTVDL